MVFRCGLLIPDTLRRPTNRLQLAREMKYIYCDHHATGGNGLKAQTVIRLLSLKGTAERIPD